LTTPHDAPRSLPDRPNLRHLKNQAKDLLRSGEAETIADAQYKIARLYGFASWPKLRAHVESLKDIGQLKLAIDANDVEGVKTLMTRNPALHRAPLGYGQDGPLTWAAECRVPYEPPAPERLLIAQWMMENGSDVHQGGDGPLMRAALKGDRVPMMELLVRHGMVIFPLSSQPARRWTRSRSNGCSITEQTRIAPTQNVNIRVPHSITS
jgi:hypothetical protein